MNTTAQPLDLDRLEREANERVRHFIARAAAQQLRRMRESWSRSAARQGGAA